MKVTPGTRHRQRVDRSHLWKKGPIKQLCEGLTPTSAGRNNQGRITVYNRSGVRRLYRNIDFKCNQLNSNFAIVKRLEYDPNRTAFIALVTPIQEISQVATSSATSGALRPTSSQYPSKQAISETSSDAKANAYVLAEASTKVGDIIRLLQQKPQVTSQVTPQASISTGTSVTNSGSDAGWAYYLHDIPVGREIYNINGKYIRAAGTCGRLTKKTDSEILVRMPSGGHISFPLFNGKSLNYACIGSLSNAEHKNEVIGKAGTNRHRGRRPHVRGVAMNPIDHPHGGGGRPGRSVTPWGKPTK